MSAYYRNKNKETTRELFNKKVIYKSELQSYGNSYSNITNFNFGEKFLYGRVSRLFVPIQIEGSQRLKSFKSVKNPSQGVNFVVDAFEALAAQFRKCAMTGKIDTTDPFLSNLVVYKAMQSPHRLYSAYRRIYFNALAATFKVDKLNVKNFDEYVEELSQLLERPTYSIPFTKPAYIKSRRCPINVSGLAVEIADLDPANDEGKITSFVESPNWEFYVNACRSYGFMIDEEMPWRLVADIGSSAMLEYAARYRLTRTDIVLDRVYSPSFITYFENFKYDLLQLYNTVTQTPIIEAVECGDKVISEVTIPTSYTAAQLDKRYSEMYFLKLYFKIRFWEDETKATKAQQEKLEFDCLEIYKTQGANRALYVFERIVNKPFDYRGSLSYISRQVAAMREASFEEEG